MANLKFYYNGIKEDGGKLQPCSYNLGNYVNLPEETITIYNREYTRFSQGIRDAFKVENDSDIMTDYFEKDRIRVAPTHPLYQQVKEAMQKAEVHNKKRSDRWNKKFNIA